VLRFMLALSEGQSGNRYQVETALQMQVRQRFPGGPGPLRSGQCAGRS
jgi:hypothetical protein